MPIQKDSEIIIAIIAGTLMLILLGIFIFLFIFFYKKKRVKHLEEKKILEENFQKELLKTQLEIREQTLRNISEEIHDNIGQTLSLAKLNLNTLKPEGNQNNIAKIIASRDLVSKAIQDLRILSRTLNTNTFRSNGLMKAIAFELNQLEKSGNYKTSLIINGDVVNMGNEKELILFRIVQESLNNIIKHAEADLIIINADFKDSYFSLRITDNGRGFKDNVESEGEIGCGLENIKNRTSLLGGYMQIESVVSRGTSIIITIPISHDESNNSAGR